MKRFIVKYATIADQVTENDFNTIEECISYCNEKTKGAQLYNSDNLNENNHFWYEVYDTSIGVWENDKVDDEHIDEASVYVTKDFWI